MNFLKYALLYLILLFTEAYVSAIVMNWAEVWSEVGDWVKKHYEQYS